MSKRGWRGRWAVASMAMAVATATIGTSTVGALAPAGVVPPAGGDALDLSSALDATGRFIGVQGLRGSLDLGTWAFVSDLASGEPPRFALVGASDGTGRQRARGARPAGVASWAAVGPDGTDPQLEQAVWALRAKKNFLYLGGDFFSLPDDGDADSLAEWDGTVYRAVGTSNNILDNSVFAIAVDGPDLYVGGTFLNADGIGTADRIAKWNGTTDQWETMGGGLNARVSAIAVSGSTIYVGGDFTDADGIATADYIATYTNGTWDNLGSHGGNGALADKVNAIAISGSDVFVGGLFTNADGDATADYIARWNGSWNALSSNIAGTNGALSDQVYALLVSGLDLFVGGNFQNVRGDATVDYVAKWRNAAWSGLGSNGGNGSLTARVYALAKAGRDLFVGGHFLDADGIATADRVARWDGSDWDNLGSDGAGDGAIDDTVYALAVFDGRVYVGGVFEDAAGIDEADYLASWALPSAYVPDGRIRVGLNGTFVGNDIYNSGAKHQRVTDDGSLGDILVYQVSVQNDSPNETDSFTIEASDVSPQHFRIRYFQGGTNITTEVEDGTYETTASTPGNDRTIKIEIKIRNTAPANGKVTRKLTITSVGDPTKVDSVKVVAERS